MASACDIAKALTRQASAKMGKHGEASDIHRSDSKGSGSKRLVLSTRNFPALEGPHSPDVRWLKQLDVKESSMSRVLERPRDHWRQGCARNYSSDCGAKGHCD